MLSLYNYFRWSFLTDCIRGKIIFVICVFCKFIDLYLIKNTGDHYQFAVDVLACRLLEGLQWLQVRIQLGKSCMCGGHIKFGASFNATLELVVYF